ncbi:hypothetical protein M758_2G187600 [Ceratodon purpureus]|nr:hypothetical protein M758_2G187600 [Ceratodon purpureus]
MVDYLCKMTQWRTFFHTFICSFSILASLWSCCDAASPGESAQVEVQFILHGFRAFRVGEVAQTLGRRRSQVARLCSTCSWCANVFHQGTLRVVLDPGFVPSASQIPA